MLSVCGFRHKVLQWAGQFLVPIPMVFMLLAGLKVGWFRAMDSALTFLFNFLAHCWARAAIAWAQHRPQWCGVHTHVCFNMLVVSAASHSWHCGQVHLVGSFINVPHQLLARPFESSASISPTHLWLRVHVGEGNFPLLVRTVSLFALHPTFTCTAHPSWRSAYDHATRRLCPTSHMPYTRILTTFGAKSRGCVATNRLALNLREHHRLYWPWIGNWGRHVQGEEFTSSCNLLAGCLP